MNHEASGAKAPVIALYTPFLQGLYIGELVNQIRQLSTLKGYRLLIIRTGGYGSFNEPLHLDSIDGAIILRNAIAPELAEIILNKGIGCVSIAYDYFPLKLPLVISDHSEGIKIAFDHLLSSGGDRIAFIGDLSRYDVRKRYESYCDLHDQHDLPLREDHLINVDDTLFSGGQAATKIFMERKLDSAAIIFGAGLTGMGFLQGLKSLPDRPETLPPCVCFDALPMIPVFTPEMASVDQNLHLIAYRAFNVLDDQLKSIDPALVTTVSPKLIRVSDNPADCYDAFIATCVDLPELHNPNYMKSLMGSMYEWPREVLASQLNQLMSIAPLFQRFMGAATLSRYYVDSKSQPWTKLLKIFTPSDVIKCDLSDRSSLCLASEFPPEQLAETDYAHDTTIHLPIRVHGKLWGMLSFFGRSDSRTPASSYFGFSGYVECLIKMYEQELEISSLKKRLTDPVNAQPSRETFEPDTGSVVEWRLEANQTSWSSQALAKLGYLSQVEVEIYGHMEITDRIHPEDAEAVRTAISEGLSNRTPIRFHARLRGKRNRYFDIIMHGQPALDEDNRVKAVVFNMAVADMGH